jgi:arginyl-tRNA synthetase
MTFAWSSPEAFSAKRFAVEPPRDPTNGDLSTNAAMVYARQARSFFANPRQHAGNCDAI